MKSLLYFLLSYFFIGIAYPQQSQSNHVNADPGYKLVWSEEFNVNGKPDTSIWNYERGFVRNEELQWYQSGNTEIKNGLLIITGRKEDVKNSKYDPNSKDWKTSREFAHYTSSSINTRGNYSFKYGIVEVKAKIDTSLGMWPAIWTLGISKNWPANGEIDIMEFYRVKDKPTLLANAAWMSSVNEAEWDGSKTPFSYFLSKDPEWAEKFHIWEMHWTEKYIRLYLDGEVLNEIDLTNAHNPDGFNPFHQPHYLLLNLALGGNGGDPIKTTFPRTYEVDYVRVYQKK